ncbi:MAG: hypothetical protein DMD78_04310 [Candidatus Rokuibacteriota bacterium]|nr:MAG: hypothetical protein DMD78_04310 [Candidatus Rokubacteria bacterium]
MDDRGKPINSHSPEVPSRPAVVISVSDVVPAAEALREVPYATGVEAALTPVPSVVRRWTGRSSGQPVTACSRYHGSLVADVEYHPMVAATSLAFNDHRRLTLSPDAIWLLIAQGFANHVNANAETLRRRLVNHQGKLEIEVRRDDFVKDSPENPWPEVFEEFAAHIRRHIGEETHELLRPTFSTTGPTEQAAADIVLLDTMQSYFDYVLLSFCGIPAITLEGTVADWQSIARRARDLARFDLGWWIDVLTPILDQFVEAASGRADRRFWQSICRVDDTSGGPFTSGWIVAFFPYLRDHDDRATMRNQWLSGPRRTRASVLFPPAEDRPSRSVVLGPTTNAFPSGLSRAPFRWQYFEESYEMEFVGGFVGVRQELATLALHPEIGWAVRSATEGG